MHSDGNGKASFRADGKLISDLSGKKESPKCAVNLPGTAVVIWKDYSLNNSGSLSAQRVTNTGNLLWTKSGVRVTRVKEEIIDYAIDSDEIGYTYQEK